LSKGIVSRLLTTKEWTGGSPRHPLAGMSFPDDMIWIQHDAKISPGSSGGPLMDEQGRLFGLNTFIHVQAEFGYASHVQYLRDLVSSASGRIEPLPDARKTTQLAVSGARILDLFDQACTFQWQPRTPDQYDVLAELATQMTLAKHAAVVGQRAATPQHNVIQRVADVADERFAALRGLSWGPSQIKALSAYAARALETTWGGVFACCSARGGFRGENALLMELDRTGDFVVLRGGSNFPQTPLNTKWLVLGFVLPQSANVRDETRTVDPRASVVLTYYMLRVP
jgi:hypothetical protein